MHEVKNNQWFDVLVYLSTEMEQETKQTLENMNAEALIDALADTLAKVEAKPIKETLPEVGLSW